MARNRSRGRSRGISRNQTQRKFVWARTNGSVIVDDTQGIVIDALADFRALYGADLVGVTIMRVRGVIFWNYTDLDLQGITGVAALRTESQLLPEEEEGPLSARHDDWMMYDATILDGPGDLVKDRRLIDVRSSRKMEEVGETLILALEHDAAGSAVSVKYNLSFGFKLP